MDADQMEDDDVREFLALALSLEEGGVRELLGRMPAREARDLRLRCVREMSISVLHALAEWVAEEADEHGTSVLVTALEGLTAGDEVGRKLAPQVATCERCMERVFTGPRCAELPACPACGGRMVRPQ